MGFYSRFIPPTIIDKVMDDKQAAEFRARMVPEAEGRVHGIAPDAVTFHEVGAWDSIADIVGAAHLIEALGVVDWSCGALPKGSGTVETSHGRLPVPAPASTSSGPSVARTASCCSGLR